MTQIIYDINAQQIVAKKLELPTGEDIYTAIGKRFPLTITGDGFLIFDDKDIDPTDIPKVLSVAKKA